MDPRRVLFVCTANICRSPTAELLARFHFGEEQVMFRSAGLLAGGRQMPKELAGVLRDRSISTANQISNQMESHTIEAAELILTMESRHVQEIAVKFPGSFDKTLPLRQAAALLGPKDSIENLCSEIADRDVMKYLSTDWDVEDPYKRGKRQYRKMVDSVDELVRSVVGSINSAGPVSA